MKLHPNTKNVKRAVMAEWLRRWTRNPMGISRAVSNPPRSVRPFFHKYIRKKLGTRTNTCVRKQLRLANRTKILNYFSWKGVVDRSVWRRPARQSSAKKRTIMHAKKSRDGIKLHQNTNNVKRSVIAEWLRRWSWTPMGTSRAGSNPARSVRCFFSENY